jgi:ABC-type phosphate transport system substrate-binding protein
MRKIALVLFALLISLSGLRRAQAQVIVIANADVKASSISKADLRDIFTGSSTSLGGGSVTPALLKSGPVHEEFLSQNVGKNDSTFRAGWRSLVFSGQASMPRSFDSEAALVDFIEHTPGAIGYVGKATPHGNAKVLSVR